MSGGVHLHLGGSHFRSTHLRSACHYTAGSRTGTHIVSSLFLYSLKVLLVFNLLLDVLVALENLVVLNFSLLQSLVHSELESLLVGSHFVGLLVHQLGLRGQDLLVSSFFVQVSLLLFEVVNSALNLVRFLIVLLLG